MEQERKKRKKRKRITYWGKVSLRTRKTYRGRFRWNITKTKTGLSSL